MAMTETKKQRLREILGKMASPEEMRQMDDADVVRRGAENMGALSDAFNMLLEDRDGTLEEIRKQKKATREMEASIVESLALLSKAIVDKLDDVKQAGYVGSKGQENYALGIQNMAKSLAEGFSTVKQSIDNKPGPVWRWPQYLYTGIRNTQFQPVDPAVDSMDIGEYDYVAMTLSGGNTTETYTFRQGGASGALQATVVIVYTSSARTIISTVTKTPIVTTASS